MDERREDKPATSGDEHSRATHRLAESWARLPKGARYAILAAVALAIVGVTVAIASALDDGEPRDVSIGDGLGELDDEGASDPGGGIDLADGGKSADDGADDASSDGSGHDDAGDEGEPGGEDDGSDDGGDGAADGSDDASESFDAGRVAFVLDGVLAVADVDGSDVETVAPVSPGSEYALSPDGERLAVVDARSRRLSIHHLETGRVEEVGPAVLEPPSWAEDSSAYAYTAPADGSGRVEVRSPAGDPVTFLGGHSPDLTARDGIVGYIEGTPESSGPVMWADLDRASAARPAGVEAAYEFAWVPSDVQGSFTEAVFACPEESCEQPGLWYAATPEDLRLLTGVPESVSRAAMFSRLTPSPDGERVAFALGGDDGYSRMFVMPIEGGEPKELSIRWDAYPLRWTPDSERIVFIEGNPFQGEPTRLMSVRPDGFDRRTLVEGASL